MRIIAGKWRGRRLEAPRRATTRPMPDRVREAIFSMLGSYYDRPGALPPLHVADLFAGSGSMGLEALSRGAACCWFYERERTALACLRRNLTSLGAEVQSRVMARDAWSATGTIAEQACTLVLLDPPYRNSAEFGAAGAVARFFNSLGAQPVTETVVVLHHERPVTYELAPDGPWRVLDRRAYGSHSITFFLRA